MKHKNHERGQSLVELAISLVMLLWLLSGVVEFGMAFFQFVQLRDAAQEGALYASTNPKKASHEQVMARIRGSSASPINLPTEVGVGGTGGAVTVEISVDHDGNPNTAAIPSPDASFDTYACEGSNHGIIVKVSYKHKIFMPFLANILGKSSDPTIPLNATVTDTILSPRCP